MDDMEKARNGIEKLRERWNKDVAMAMEAGIRTLVEGVLERQSEAFLSAVKESVRKK